MRTEACGREGLVASMPRVDATVTFFFHVDDFTMRRDLAVAARHTPTRERREPEQANETHHGDSPRRASTQSNFCTDEVKKGIIFRRERIQGRGMGWRQVSG